MAAKRDYTGSKKVTGVNRVLPSRKNLISKNSVIESDKNTFKERSDSSTTIKKKPTNNRKHNDEFQEYSELEFNQDDLSVSPRYSFSTEIPERYNETYITAIPKDPNTLYVYWEFSDDTIELMNTTMDQIGSQVVLRVKDTENSDTLEDVLSFHIELSKQQEEQYFKVPESGKEYQVECGCLSSKGKFLLIAQSDPVIVPNTQSEYLLLETVYENSDNNSFLEEKVDLNSKNGCNSQICSSLSNTNFGSAVSHDS